MKHCFGSWCSGEAYFHLDGGINKNVGVLVRESKLSFKRMCIMHHTFLLRFFFSQVEIICPPPPLKKCTVKFILLA
jgi:hypothetical protein